MPGFEQPVTGTDESVEAILNDPVDEVQPGIGDDSAELSNSKTWTPDFAAGWILDYMHTHHVFPTRDAVKSEGGQTERDLFKLGGMRGLAEVSGLDPDLVVQEITTTKERWTRTRLRAFMPTYIHEYGKLTKAGLQKAKGPGAKAQRRFGGLYGMALICGLNPLDVLDVIPEEETLRALNEWPARRTYSGITTDPTFPNALIEHELGILQAHPKSILRATGSWRLALERACLATRIDADACISFGRELIEDYPGERPSRLVSSVGQLYRDPDRSDYPRIFPDTRIFWNWRVRWEKWQFDQLARPMPADKLIRERIWLCLGISALARLEGDTPKLEAEIDDMRTRRLGPPWLSIPFETLSGLDQTKAARIRFIDAVDEAYILLAERNNRLPERMAVKNNLVSCFVPELEEHGIKWLRPKQRSKPKNIVS